jgi:hypothetical protein
MLIFGSGSDQVLTQFVSLPTDLFSLGCVRVLAFLSRVKARPGFGAVEIALGFVSLAFSCSAPSWLSRLRPEATAPPPLVPIFVKGALGSGLSASRTSAAVGVPAFPAARRHGLVPGVSHKCRPFRFPDSCLVALEFGPAAGACSWHSPEHAALSRVLQSRALGLLTAMCRLSSSRAMILYRVSSRSG